MKNTKPNFNFLFYFFIISILFLNLTIAVTPNQMQINFDIYSGEEVCKVISVSSNKEIQAIIQDIWTANYENGNLREYTTDPSEHGLEIKYNPNLDFSKASSIDVEICIKANKIGKFRGALVFAPQNQTGNVIQYSTWLKVTVTEKPQPQEPENNNNKPNPKTSSGNPIPTTTTPPSINTQTNQTTQQPQEEQETQHPQEPQEQETQQPKQPQEQQEPQLLITGNVIGFIEKNYYIGIIFLAIFLIAFLLIYIKKQKTKKMNKIYLTIFVTLLLTTSLALAMTIEQTLTATVVIIENQTQTPCVFENQDVNLYIDIDSGGIDLTNQVIFSYTINEITKNKTAQLKPGTQNTYFYTISSSELIGGENVTWKVYLNSIETNENSFYIRKNTILEINPQQPDGKNNWYITEPEFTLIHDNNPLAQVINTYYYWNGLGQIQYTNPFGLDDISNQPKESAGTLKLTYWSEYQCATEEINYKWLYIDLTPPQFKDHLPAPNSINKQNKTTIQAYISEIYGSNSGINLSSIQMKINGQPVQLNTYPHQELNAIVNYSAELPDAIYQIEISAKDYAGNSNTTSWTFEIDSKLPSYELKINSPQEKIYNNRRINFDIETETPADEIMYADLSRPRIIYRRLCRNCNSFKRDFFFRDANNSLSFRSIKDGEIVSEKNISFFVDSTSPRITRIMPIRGFTNGSFQVQFREQNPKNLTLFYANTHKNFEVDLEKCTFQRNTYTCNLNVDLSDYENQEITYWFELTDIAENKDASRKYSILVDTTPPEIQIEYEITRGLIELEIKVKEENFDRITYINTKDPRQIERLLCTRLFDSVCKTRISLRDANHSLIIIAKDKAGNQFQDNKTFENIFIDTRPPRITQTEPRIGYTNSTFQIQFVEENTKEVTLYYSNNTGQKTKKLNLQENCKFNRINLCSIDANLTELENQQIEYYFKVKDIVNNTATSRKTKLTVDIQPPIIQDSSYVQQIGFRRVEFFLNLTEKNFKEAYYINLNDPLQTKRRLCTRLNAQNICKVTRFFSYGENNILIIIKDKAENTASLQENLFIT